jgi:hypothetical protein
MAIRKPSVSVTEAKRLAKGRAEDPAAAALTIPTPLVGVRPQENAPPGAAPPPVSALAIVVPHERAEPLAPDLAGERSPPARVVRHTPGDGVFPELKPAEAKLQVFLSAPLPAAGVSLNFDALRRQYSSQKALQMILRRALDSYEVRLENGSYRTAPTDYVPGEPASGILIIQTSRMIPVRLIDVARRHFDPLGFESTRAFGRKLACAALASFFEAEKKPK